MHRGFVTRIEILAALALSIPAAAAMGQQPNPATPEPPDEYTVGLAPGDQIEAHFLDFPESSDMHLYVSPSGTIFVPYAGQVKVAGLMPDKAEEAVVEALRDRQVVKSPQVSLTPITARNLSVMVLGAVSLPHQVPLFAPAPLSAVLAQVGPFAPVANYHVMVAHRDGSPPADVELDRTGKSARGLGTMVNPGDVVTVVTAGSFFALGEFNHPGIFPIVGTQHMTLMQAIAVAGGPDLYAGLSKARILRNVDGHREEIMVDLAKLHEGKVADPLIQTDDIIFVPRNTFKVVVDSWLNQSLYALTAVDVVKNY
jgi:polysaccharide biosynthesis/export protein